VTCPMRMGVLVGFGTYSSTKSTVAASRVREEIIYILVYIHIYIYSIKI
jgi:hypothetical protein